MIRTLLVLLLCLAFAKEPEAVTLVRVIDGDTIKIVENGRNVSVRLWGIDAPELAQSFGKESRDFLHSRCAGARVAIVRKGKDKYRRILGIVFCNGENMNEALVQNGFAWAYLHKKYVPLMESARKQRRGLWSERNRVAPHLWRQKRG